MGTVISASASMVLELGALVIYDVIFKILTHVWRGDGPGGRRMDHFTKFMLKNNNTLYFIMKFIDIMIYVLIHLCIILFYPKTIILTKKTMFKNSCQVTIFFTIAKSLEIIYVNIKKTKF